MTPAIRTQSVRPAGSIELKEHKTKVTVVQFLGGDVGRVRAVVINEKGLFESCPIEELAYDPIITEEKVLAKLQGPVKMESSNSNKGQRK